MSIAVTDTGGDGPAVLLLHGLAGSSREMRPTADALRDSHRVLLSHDAHLDAFDDWVDALRGFLADG